MEKHTVRVIIDTEEKILMAEHDSNLRQTLLGAGISPYATLTRKLNCGGRGLCATCGVVISEGEPLARHWHDRLADTFGYPRLSCQVKIEAAMTVRILTDKKVWGKRQKS